MDSLNKALFKRNTMDDLEITTINLRDTNKVIILQSVCMPLRKMYKTVNVALVSLCLQENAVPWELLIFADKDSISAQKLNDWKDYLRQANCARIVFIKDTRQNAICYLGYKWIYMFHRADPTSLSFVLQAGDCYSDPDRLDTHFKNHIFSWQHYSQGHFYDIQRKQLVLFKNEGVTGLDMAIRADIARKFSLADPQNNLSKSVDHWLYKRATALSPVPFQAKDLGPKKIGVDLHGLNLISKERGEMIEHIVPPFYDPLPDYKLPIRLQILIEKGEI